VSALTILDPALPQPKIPGEIKTGRKYNVPEQGQLCNATRGNGSVSRKFAASTPVVACKYHHEGREEHEVYKKAIRNRLFADRRTSFSQRSLGKSLYYYA
jgi:hypothetical protein